ncbi:MAG: hypothetical protein GAK41_01407 [Burkholderia gladioli]|nr:MAG: hypothetical protein GAK41_01407 [Burkholderia gladioli]
MRDQAQRREHAAVVVHVKAVDAGHAIVHQARARQHEAARAEADQRRAGLGRAQQIVSVARVGLIEMRQQPADHYHVVEARRIGERRLHRHRNAATRFDRLALDARDGPQAAQLAALVAAIGRVAQRVAQPGQRQQREFRPHHDRHAQFRAGRTARPRVAGGGARVERIDERCARRARRAQWVGGGRQVRRGRWQGGVGVGHARTRRREAGLGVAATTACADCMPRAGRRSAADAFVLFPGRTVQCRRFVAAYSRSRRRSTAHRFRGAGFRGQTKAARRAMPAASAPATGVQRLRRSIAITSGG